MTNKSSHSKIMSGLDEVLASFDDDDDDLSSTEISHKSSRPKRNVEKFKTIPHIDDHVISPKKRKTAGMRKNIRTIIKQSEIKSETIAAQQAELLRLQRVQKRDDSSQSPVKSSKSKKAGCMSSPHKTFPSSGSSLSSDSPNVLKKFKNSSKIRKSLRDFMTSDVPGSSETNAIVVVTDDEKDEDDNDVVIVEEEEILSNKMETQVSAEEVNNYCDVIELSDDEEEQSNEMVCPPEECGLSTSGADMDDPELRAAILAECSEDRCHKPDEKGRILVNVRHVNDDKDIFIAPHLVKQLKPHQIGGIRFMYDNVVDSFYHFKTSQGFGCILAHSMGLGKTLQVIGFLDILFRFVPGARTCLLIVPINTLLNWINEFDYWLPVKEDSSDNLRPFYLFYIGDNAKNVKTRQNIIQTWHLQGGVLLIGYEMFRTLSNQNGMKHSHSSSTLDSTKNEKIIDLREALLDPGPQIVICDEGHRIKNSEAAISKSLKRIRTRRRIVLTGYPLQNNLLEYWCMVDFVRPNYLGDRQEFTNMFQRPIENGQCIDSTDEDRKVMQGRAHVLHELLRGFVLRRSHAILKGSLTTKKCEYVLCIRLSDWQKRLYKSFMSYIRGENCVTSSSSVATSSTPTTTTTSGTSIIDGSCNALKTYAMCFKIWNTPDILRQCVLKYQSSEIDLNTDLDLNDLICSYDAEPTESNVPTSSFYSSPSTSAKPSSSATELPTGSRKVPDKEFEEFYKKHLIPNAPGSAQAGNNNNYSSLGWNSYYDWALSSSMWLGYLMHDLQNSGKLTILFSLLKHCISVGDKVLVFTQSLLTLNIIEDFLKDMQISPNCAEKWQKNVNYFRLDGSTPSSERDKQINQFNNPQSSVKLFLLSTRAGCLGINLIAANRVIMMDASWNPCHDCQAVCRVYRYGQMKSCFIYRLIADGTMEKKIYDRQIRKQSVADRVVDELNPMNQFTKQQVEDLLEFREDDASAVLSLNEIKEFNENCPDNVLVAVLRENYHWLTKKPFTHESLLIDRKDIRLTQTEKQLAKESYENERLMVRTLSHTDASFTQLSSSARNRRELLLKAVAARHIPSTTEQQNRHLTELVLNRSSSGALASQPSIEYAGRLAAEQLQLDLEEQRQLQKKEKLALLMKEMEMARQRELNKKSSTLSFNDNNNVTLTTPPCPTTPLAQPDFISLRGEDETSKVTRIPVTTDLYFPSSTSSTVSTSTSALNQQNKVCAGEVVELIENSRGQFIRIPQTGVTYAINNNNSNAKQTAAAAASSSST